MVMTAPVGCRLSRRSQRESTSAEDRGSRKVTLTATVVLRPSGAGEFVVAFVLPASLTADSHSTDEF
jgi:hypothetical protein